MNVPKTDDIWSRPIPTNWATTNSRSTARLQPEILNALPAVQEIYCRLSGNPNRRLEITGGQEWGHSFFSLHHTGFAVDVRTKDLPGGGLGRIADQICNAVQAKLGAKYFVYLEGRKKGEVPHLHIEFKPGVKISNPVDTAYVNSA